MEVTLSPAQLRQFDAASAGSPGFPHNLLTRELIRAIVFGGPRNRIKA